MKRIYLFSIALAFSTFLHAQQMPEVYDIPAQHLETDNQGNFYGASATEIYVFNVDGNVSDTITPDFNEPFGKIVDFRIGLDGEMYLLYDFSNGIYRMDDSGALTKVLDGRYRYFEVDDAGGILAAIENGGEDILRYVNGSIDTTLTLDDNISASNLVFDVQIDADNTFWIGYAKGILSYKNSELIRHNENPINDLFVGKDGRIYVIYSIFRAGYKEADEDEITGIDSNDATGRKICGDGNGRIFVSNDNIVYLFANGEWNNFEISDNVFIGAIDFVVDDQNNVVMSSNQGKMFIWKQLPTNIQEVNKKELVRIYPNPSADFIHLAPRGISISDQSPYAVISSNGTLLKRGFLSGNQIDIKGLASGTYILHLEELKMDVKFVKY